MIPVEASLKNSKSLMPLSKVPLIEYSALGKKSTTGR